MALTTPPLKGDVSDGTLTTPPSREMFRMALTTPPLKGDVSDGTDTLRPQGGFYCSGGDVPTY